LIVKQYDASSWTVYTDSCIGASTFLFGIVAAGADVKTGVTFGVKSTQSKVRTRKQCTAV
jgi:hypothetical protein